MRKKRERKNAEENLCCSPIEKKKKNFSLVFLALIAFSVFASN
jgi:hypothetical protein